MFRFIGQSLQIRAGLAMGLITLLALTGMVSAVIMARSTYGVAAAVNQAGSLRMQSYRIVAALESRHIDQEAIRKQAMEFHSRLESPRLTRVLKDTERKSLHTIYRQISDQWQEVMYPLLSSHLDRLPTIQTTAELEQHIDQLRRQYSSRVDPFVAEIDRFVYLLEQDAESRLHKLGLIQGICLMLTLLVLASTLYLVHTDVLGPLRELLFAAERAGKGNFSVRVGHIGMDELGRLGLAFNNMAAELSKMYGNLEKRVSEKTAELQTRNLSLQLLYSATQQLTKVPVSQKTYHALLEDISRVVGIRSGTLCLTPEQDGDKAYRVALNGPVPPMCSTEACHVCLGNGNTQLLTRKHHGGSSKILSIPIHDQEHNYGVLLLQKEPGANLAAWQMQLLETLGQHIGIAVGVSRRDIQRRRLALLDERSVIARELHDSLAQSLSYLKIQVTRLTILMDREAEKSQIDEVMTELREGLAASYRQLRELLTTFRLQMDGRNVVTALAETVAEFNKRNKVAITLNNHTKNIPFSANEEIHVLQIVREALANVTYHSAASSANVTLEQLADNRIEISVEDDGIGMPPEAERSHHYGLAIMQERARSLRGDLNIRPLGEGGTRVSVTFTPIQLSPDQNNNQQADVAI